MKKIITNEEKEVIRTQLETNIRMAYRSLWVKYAASAKHKAYFIYFLHFMTVVSLFFNGSILYRLFGISDYKALFIAVLTFITTAVFAYQTPDIFRGFQEHDEMPEGYFTSLFYGLVVLCLSLSCYVTYETGPLSLILLCVPLFCSTVLMDRNMEFLEIYEKSETCSDGMENFMLTDSDMNMLLDGGIFSTPDGLIKMQLKKKTS